MSDGAFRDDQEAALARADALEQELAQAKHENEELKKLVEKKAAKPPKPPKARRPPDASPKESIFNFANIVIAVLVVGAIISAVIVPLWRDRRAAARDRRQAQGAAVIGAAHCLRSAIAPDPGAFVDPATQDPRTQDPRSGTTGRVQTNVVNSNCKLIDKLVDIDAFAPISRDLRIWSKNIAAMTAAAAVLEDYYRNRDWKDDSYASGPRKWLDYQAASHDEHASAQDFAVHGLPIVIAELRRYQAAYLGSNGKDEVWWTLELGIQVQIAENDWLRGDTAKGEAELAAVDAAVANAPLEVRRAWRAHTRWLKSSSFHNDLLDSLGKQIIP